MEGSVSNVPEVDPPWKRATQKRRSQCSERQGAKLDGGFTTAMSGAGWKKGDYHANGYLVEDKFTDADSFRVEKKVLAKTEAEALASGKLPQWRISLPGFRLRVLREEDYLYLEALAAKNGHES